MDISLATAAYAEYVNGHPWARANFDEEQLALYEEDMAKAKHLMERLWLESKPVLENECL